MRAVSSQPFPIEAPASLSAGRYDVLAYHQGGRVQWAVYGADGRLVGFVRNADGGSWFPNAIEARLALADGAVIS